MDGTAAAAGCRRRQENLLVPVAPSPSAGVETGTSRGVVSWPRLPFERRDWTPKPTGGRHTSQSRCRAEPSRAEAELAQPVKLASPASSRAHTRSVRVNWARGKGVGPPLKALEITDSARPDVRSALYLPPNCLALLFVFLNRKAT